MIILMFICALALSGAAGFYSIVGLMAIFAAAPIPIAIMGTTLEISKLVVASWLYRNWKPIPLLMKSYLTIALFVLMALTSMGIFGFLSKAHLDQGVPTGDIAAHLTLLDEKIKIEKENIDAARKQLSQLDSQVDQTIARTAANADDSGIRRSVSIRKAQARERSEALHQIETSQTKIAKLNEERSPIAAQYRKVEAEVGPIKYIAALIYGDNADQTLLEKAVRWVIIMIVVVFDPLAVVMLIAANWSMRHRNDEVEIVEVLEQTTQSDKPAPVQPEPEPEQLHIEEKPFNWLDHPYLRKPFVHFKRTTPIVAPKEKVEVPTPEEHPAFEPDSENFWRSRPRVRQPKKAVD